MEDLTEASIGYERIEALLQRDRIAHAIGCRNCGPDEPTVFWLAVLGWTPAAFLEEAYPEFYGGAL